MVGFSRSSRRHNRSSPFNHHPPDHAQEARKEINVPKVHAEYEIRGQKLLLFPGSVKAAGWIARNSTTNVHDTLHYERRRGQEVVTQMREDGLTVTLQTS